MNITIDDAYKDFIEDRKTYVSDKTLEFYTDNISKFVAFCHDNYAAVYMAELPDSVLKDYVLYLRTKKKFEGHPFTPESDKAIKNSSVRIYTRAVKSFLNFCKQEHYIEDYKKVKMPRNDARQIIPLYAEEIEKIDQTFKINTMMGLRDFCIVHLMLDAGFRSQEVINLKIQDVLFDKDALLVVNSKGSVSRIVIMCPLLKSRLSRYIYLYRYGSAPTDAVFIQIKTKEPINENVIKQFFARLKKKSCIDRLHPHLLRHTFATSYVMGGGNLEMLRILLGHSDYDVTKNYLHLANQYQILQASIYKLDPVFFQQHY